MTASQALRKGANKFATDLASLTGGDSSIGPPPSVLRKGMSVEVNFRASPSESRTTSSSSSSSASSSSEKASLDRWYPGKIMHVKDSESGGEAGQPVTYNVQYTDGTEESGITIEKIRAIGSQGTVGGVLFCDEAYDLDPANNSEGKAIMAEIMSAAEDHRDKVTIIIAGYKDDIENKLFSFNSGMASRFININFEDFNQSQIEQIWIDLCTKRGYECSPEARIVASRRLFRQAHVKGFGNARSVRKMVEATITESKRRYLRADARGPYIEVEDVIGTKPDRQHIRSLDEAFCALECMTGLKRVKEEMYQILELAKSNYEKEMKGDQIEYVALNRVMLGNPGTVSSNMQLCVGRQSSF